MDIESTGIERLFIANHQRLYAVARQMLKDDAEAGDAVSDVFAKLAEVAPAPSGGLPDGGSPQPVFRPSASYDG